MNETTGITGPGAPGWIVPGYDAAGNMLSGPKPGDETTRQHYKWDAWNRLVAVYADDNGSPGDLIATYRYDGLNRRVKKDLASGTDVVYLWDGWQMIEEREYDAGDSAWEARRQFVYGGLYIDEPVAFDKDTDSDGDCTEGNGGSTRYLYAQQVNFNVVALTDASGTLVERVKYDPYGEATVTVEQGQSASGNPYLFTGRPWDAESHLYYFRNRYYSPRLGRWMSWDPRGYKDGMNLLEYVGTEPVSKVDPSGLSLIGPYGGSVPSRSDGTEDCHYESLGDPYPAPEGYNVYPPPERVILTFVMNWLGQMYGDHEPVEDPPMYVDYELLDKACPMVPIPGPSGVGHIALPAREIAIRPWYFLARQVQRGEHMGVLCRKYFRCTQECKKRCCNKKTNEWEETVYIAKEPFTRKARGRIGDLGIEGIGCVVPEENLPQCPNLCTKEYD